jgi:tRNA threonylcarbamoyladenosine biosynthesis protein TsaB
MLLPAVHELLENHGLTPADIDLIAVGTGPGTFSGLRVGIATARALAQALEIPLVGSSTLAAIAQGIAGTVKNKSGGKPVLLPVIDAKRGQVFAQLFSKDGPKVKPLSEIFCLGPEALAEKISQLVKEPVVTAGNGVVSYYEIFSQCKLVEPLPQEDEAHRVRAAFHLPPREVQPVYHPGKLLGVVPNYVRQPDADKNVLLRKRKPWQ